MPGMEGLATVQAEYKQSDAFRQKYREELARIVTVAGSDAEVLAFVSSSANELAHEAERCVARLRADSFETLWTRGLSGSVLVVLARTVLGNLACAVLRDTRSRDTTLYSALFLGAVSVGTFLAGYWNNNSIPSFLVGGLIVAGMALLRNEKQWMEAVVTQKLHQFMERQ